ncbi:c-type cytochrome [Microbulbifer thermotolerans]|uniref:C-type cytochrome n=1 Tax=Microbulbifer thermotolerans TaxID=252514 RepID=A0A143HIY6_MICTH|nr:c-type cytochrome [Microbulbifer thermotolerans]AMX01232.1 cytochrome C [Microbulbifer thermotolerans]MCX2778444.1 c-type cytochrome [Microbulbifer thermotolerans]MCX2783914.1 c-type cytochrome [Microbulbifer thermotolerans]MCX2793927.1 c-type cytochrome [Microbulbifer thermotolerans]MCX2802520.1 c-type cytochrome [Microbulbifer thermotolerans]
MNSIIKNTALALGLTFGLAAPVVMAAGDPAAGKAKATACAACHGADGNSLAPAFPKIAGLGEKYLAKQLMDIKSGARQVPQMIGQLDNFNEQDLQDLAAYFASQPVQLSGSKAISVTLNNGESVDGLMLGRELFRAGNPETGVPACMGCHSPTGKGNAPAGYPRLSGQYAEYVETQLKAFRAGTRTNDGDTRVMRSVAKQLSDAEITALANYVAGLTD